MSCKPLLSPEAEYMVFEEFPKLAAQQCCTPTSTPAAQTQGTLEGGRTDFNFRNYESYNKAGKKTQEF